MIMTPADLEEIMSQQRKEVSLLTVMLVKCESYPRKMRLMKQKGFLKMVCARFSLYL